MPATLRPFIAEIATMSRIVPTASPPRIGPVQTWNIRYRSLAIPDSDSM